MLYISGKLVEVGYGIKKLQISCVVEDLKVSVDELSEKITEDFEEHVCSVVQIVNVRFLFVLSLTHV